MLPECIKTYEMRCGSQRIYAHIVNEIRKDYKNIQVSILYIHFECVMICFDSVERNCKGRDDT
jgi:hypothetical protein